MIKMVIATVVLVLFAGCATVSGIGKDLSTGAEWTKEKMK
jgi:predicted small secreted protein